MWEQLIGKAPIVEATVGGVTTRFLVDTGNQVSTITETFYRTHLAQTENHLQDPNNWLTIRAANGLTVPYVGYLELDIEVCGVVVPKRGVLVVKDSDERKGDVCGLLGTNVLCHVPAMSDALRSMTDAEDTPQDVARIVRVAGCRLIFVPAHSTMAIPARGYCRSGTAIVEPLSTAITGNILTLNTLVASDSFLVKVMQNSTTGVTLNPGTRIGIIRSATVYHPGKVEIGLNEIMLSTVDRLVESAQMTRKEPIADVLADLDLSGLQDNPAVLDKARAIFERHVGVFASSEDDLGCTDAVKHRIITSDDRPVAQPYRRVPPTQLDEVKEQLEKLLRTGVIVPSHSDHASPIVLVRKKSGALRMCVDYRTLNAKTIKDAYALPRIVESMDAMTGSKWFSTLDLQSAYNQVQMQPEDQQKTAFTTPFGLYEYTRMPFGLCKGTGSFYIAQYPVRWTAQSALHFLPPLADLFIPTPTRLLRGAF